MSLKARRQAAIGKAIGARQVASQEQLRELLAAAGFEAGQATLSRDLRELGVVKGPAGYALPGSPPQPRHDGKELDLALRSLLLSAERAGNLAVLKTGPGRAQALAVEIDRTPPPQVVGVIAGDDTLFLACRSDADADKLVSLCRRAAGISR